MTIKENANANTKQFHTRTACLSSFTMVVATLLLCGCTTTNFATSPNTTIVREEWTRTSLLVWGGSRIYQIGNIRFEYSIDERDISYTVDSGKLTLLVWYYGRREGRPGLFFQSELASLSAELKPGARYIVRAKSTESTASFALEDEATGNAIATSIEVPIVVRNSGVTTFQPNSVNQVPVSRIP